MKFEFATAGRIVAGPGSARDAARIITEFGRRVLIVTGKNPARADWLVKVLATASCSTHVFPVAGEPTVGVAQAGAEMARAEKSEVIVGLGGGSALDAAKAGAALAANGGDVFDYLEVIGRGQPLPLAPLPCVAIPTTAGTGSEVTRNAVLASPTHQLKVSLRSPLMLPKVAIVDPVLALALPLEMTASTGCDALVQLVEPFVSVRANPVTDALCREGMRRVAGSLAELCGDLHNLALREEMAVASLFGGIALANAGLGAVHGLASPIGGKFPAPHGAVCGILLAPALEVNLRAMRRQGLRVTRFDEVARILTGNPAAGADDAIRWVSNLVEGLGIPRLSAYGIKPEHAESLATAALETSSMKANPVQLSLEDCAEIVCLGI